MAGAEQTHWVVQQARALGFDLCGVAPVEGLEELARLPEWLDRGYAGEMRYLHDPRRADPRDALPGAGSLIVCALNYNTPLPYSTEDAGAQQAAPLRETAAAKSESENRNSATCHPEPATADEGSALESNAKKNADSSSSRSFGACRNDNLPLFQHPARHSPRGWISRYAWGDDYHAVVGERLEALLAAMRREFPEPFDARAYVDTGPVVERVAAKYAGLGWLAKNTCLINEKLGSWLFLGVIVTTLELEPSLAPAESPPPDLCGNCTLCLEACPTGAIVEPYLLDARRCISYLTIELRGTVPEEFRPAMGRMVFGCDICQDVCPWNHKAPVTRVAEFLPREAQPKQEGTEEPCHSESAWAGEESDCSSLPSNAKADSGRHEPPTLGMTARGETRHSLFAPRLDWLASLSEDEFRRVFRGGAIKRTKWQGLVRNACIALGNCGVRKDREPEDHARLVDLLERLAASDDAVIAEHAQWASRKL